MKAVITVSGQSLIREPLPMRVKVEIPFDKASKTTKPLKILVPKEKFTVASTCVTVTVGKTRVTKKAGRPVKVDTSVSVARGATVTVSLLDPKGKTISAKKRTVKAGVTFWSLKTRVKAKGRLQLVVLVVAPGETITKKVILR